jgi:hypothetical protein
MEREKIFVYALIMILGLGIFPLMQEAIIDKDMSGWTFTGAAFVIRLLGVLPYIWLAAFILIPAYFIMQERGA